MFDFVRKHTKLMMGAMFLLIIPAFVLVGVDGYRSVSAGGETVATLGGQKIKQGEWDAIHQAESDQFRKSAPNIDPKILDSAEARYNSLERLVNSRLVTLAAEDLHLVVSDARFRRLFRESPEFASFRKPDGSLDSQRYAQAAASQGMNAEMFDLAIKRQLSERQVESGVLGTALATNAQVKAALDPFFERREVQVARFEPASYIGRVNPSEADVEAYYQANLPLFQAPESANIEYVVLDIDAVKKTISLSEADLKSYYDQNVSALSGKEERRASHILISAPKDASAEQKQKARERAQQLLDQVRKAPESFAEVARKNSQDPGSAASGGDLDFFSRGAMVKPFEDAAYALKKGEISALVESDFGFHIIRLTDIKAPKQKSFEELRASIEADLRVQQAQRKYAEVADTFTNAVYEQADDLKSVASKLKLELQTANDVRRNTAPAGTSVLSNPKLLAAIFSSDATEKKRNTEAVEVAPNRLVAARVTQYFPARTQALSEVRASVRERLIASRAAEMARKEGEERLKSWKAQAESASMPAAVTVSRDAEQTLQGTLLDAALRADASKLPAWVGVDLGAQGYAVIRVNKVMDRKPPQDANARQEKAQYAQWLASAESQAYLEALKARYKVQIRAEKPAKPGTTAAATP